MIPYLLAAVGGYLLGNSMKGQTFADGSPIQDNNIKKDEKGI